MRELPARQRARCHLALARHDVLLTPVYTPTLTDERNVSREQVFFGGISVFLEQHSSIFRHTPRFLAACGTRRGRLPGDEAEIKVVRTVSAR